VALTNYEKRELARQVKRSKELGYGKTEAIDKISKAYAFKKRIVKVYWKIFNEKEPSAVSGKEKEMKRNE